MEEMEKKFTLIKTLENWRWNQDIKEYSFENSFYTFKTEIDKCFTNDEFNIEDTNLAEKILLTHYLIYICDRQMDYRHIFKAGGYVISSLVEEYLSQRKPNNEYDWNKIFKIVRENKGKVNGEDKYSYYLCAEIDSKDGKIYEYFEKRKKILNKDTDNDKYLKFFEYDKDKEYALFSSRYMLQDIGCMYKTLKYLNGEYLSFTANSEQKSEDCHNKKDKKYNGSFGTFLKEHSNKICEYNDKNKKIKKDSVGLAKALFELTYQAIPQITVKDIKYDTELNFDTVINSISKKMVDKINGNSNNFSLENNRHSLKRMWCIIRDFLRHPVFKDCFKLIIGDDEFKSLIDNEQEKIELPGDVWNNNSTFALCFWGNADNNFKSSVFVRKEYNKNKDCWNKCLPIDFDITFNFVPRMCEEDKCEICPLGNNEWKKSICPNDTNKLCPLALYSCGIKHKCDREECEL